MQDTKDTIEYVCENVGKANTLVISLLIVLGINIFMTVIKIITDFILKNKDKSNHKANLIAEQAIDIQKKVFNNLNDLSLCNASQQRQLLSKIQGIKKEILRNRIYFPKSLFKTSFKILDYFMIVAGDYSKKDVQFETKTLTQYSEQFNG